MPSLRHQFLATVVHLTRPRGDVMSPEARERIARRNATRDRRLPTAVTRGLDRHFDHQVETVGRGASEFAVHVLTPRGGATATLLHLHGGAYVAGIDPFHVRWLTKVARRLKARIVLPDYPLAPGFTWRDSFDQMREVAARWAATAAEEGGPFWLTGDSAGGGYALGLAQTMRDSGAAMPDKMVLISPWLDLALATPGTDEVAQEDPWLVPENLREFGRWWAGFETSRAEVSPLNGSVDDLPRTLMFIGTRDSFHPGCVALSEKAAGAGWDLTMSVEPGAVHVYPLLPGIPEAHRALEQTLYFLKS